MMRKFILLALALVLGMSTLAAAPSVASAQSYTAYVVQRGDSLSKIAARYCTTWQEIYNMNYQAIGPNPSVVEPGTVLTVVNRCGGGGGGGGTGGVYDRGPRTHATGSYSQPYYTVAWGDTLTSVAARFGVTVDALMRANNLYSSVIQPGQVLLIPGAGGGQPQPPQPPPSGNAERVNFAPGAIAANRTGQITYGAPKTYVLGARAGQSMEIYTTSHGEPLSISVRTAGGQQLALGGTNNSLSNYVFTQLPVSGDYFITITPTTAPESPTLNFDITFAIR